MNTKETGPKAGNEKETAKETAPKAGNTKEAAKEAAGQVMTKVKSVINKENMNAVNEKYLKPFLALCIRILRKIWELIVQYTPVVIALLKTLWNKLYALSKDLYQKMTAKKNPPPPPSSPSAGPTPPPSA